MAEEDGASARPKKGVHPHPGVQPIVPQAAAAPTAVSDMEICDAKPDEHELGLDDEDVVDEAPYMLGDPEDLEEAVVGRRISIFERRYQQWYQGTVTEYNHEHGQHFVAYDDGDRAWVALGEIKYELMPTYNSHVVGRPIGLRQRNGTSPAPTAAAAFGGRGTEGDAPRQAVARQAMARQAAGLLTGARRIRFGRG